MKLTMNNTLHRKWKRARSSTLPHLIMPGADDDIDLAECVMARDALTVEVHINVESLGLCIQSIKDKDYGKFEIVISGIAVGTKVIFWTNFRRKDNRKQPFFESFQGYS